MTDATLAEVDRHIIQAIRDGKDCAMEIVDRVIESLGRDDKQVPTKSKVGTRTNWRTIDARLQQMRKHERITYHSKAQRWEVFDRPNLGPGA